eukprot:tig00020951_g16435.t1
MANRTRLGCDPLDDAARAWEIERSLRLQLRLKIHWDQFIREFVVHLLFPLSLPYVHLRYGIGAVRQRHFWGLAIDINNARQVAMYGLLLEPRERSIKSVEFFLFLAMMIIRATMVALKYGLRPKGRYERSLRGTLSIEKCRSEEVLFGRVRLDPNMPLVFRESAAEVKNALKLALHVSPESEATIQTVPRIRKYFFICPFALVAVAAARRRLRWLRATGAIFCLDGQLFYSLALVDVCFFGSCLVVCALFGVSAASAAAAVPSSSDQPGPVSAADGRSVRLHLVDAIRMRRRSSPAVLDLDVDAKTQQRAAREQSDSAGAGHRPSEARCLLCDMALEHCSCLRHLQIAEGHIRRDHKLQPETVLGVRADLTLCRLIVSLFVSAIVLIVSQIRSGKSDSVDLGSFI